ncbi:hypothetical protein V8G54_006738 [Vigna mungo]|uniref:Uncharacterized protein n=1 Tax=Vigna mungo TaxID=3915 RepID=A0AAQ3P243_VIGMU
MRFPHGAKLHALVDTYFSDTDHRNPRAYKGTRGGLAVCISASDDDRNAADTLVPGNENPSVLISFASKTLNAGQVTSKLHVIELEQRTMEAWEQLDIDESVVDSFIRRCNLNNSVILGLAGVIEAAMLNRN